MCQQILNGSYSEIVRGKGAAPLLENMSLIENQIDKAVCEFLHAIEIFKLAVVIEYFGTDNNDLILSVSKALDVKYQHDSQEGLGANCIPQTTHWSH